MNKCWVVVKIVNIPTEAVTLIDADFELHYY